MDKGYKQFTMYKLHIAIHMQNTYTCAHIHDHYYPKNAQIEITIHKG